MIFTTASMHQWHLQSVLKTNLDCGYSLLLTARKEPKNVSEVDLKTSFQMQYLIEPCHS